MTAPTLLSDGELQWALAGPDGLPQDFADPRIEAWEAAGRIRLYGDRWRWQVRIPSQLTRAQREVIAEDIEYERRCCDV